MGNDFAGNVNQPPANRVGIGADGYHRCSDVRLEGLHQKVTQQHRIIPRGIGIEPLKRQLLMTEVFKCTIFCQFIAAAFMLAGNKTIGLEIIPGTALFSKPSTSWHWPMLIIIIVSGLQPGR